MRASRGQASARATPAADGMHAAPGSVALTVWGGTTPGVAMPGSYEGDTMRALRCRASARATPAADECTQHRAATVWGGTTPGVALPCSDEGDAACCRMHAAPGSAARSGIDEGDAPADAPTTMRVAPITMRVAPTRGGTTARRRVGWCQAERCQAPTDGDDAEYTCVCGTDQAERQRPEAWGAVPSGTVSGPRPTAMLQSALEMGGRMDAALVGVAPTVWGGTTQCGRREVRHRRGDAARCTPTTMRLAPTRWGTNEQRRVARCQAERCRCANHDACGANQVGHQRAEACGTVPSGTVSGPDHRASTHCAEACGMVPSRTQSGADRRQSAECTRSQRSRATRSSVRRCAMHFRERSGVTRPQSAFESG